MIGDITKIKKEVAKRKTQYKSLCRQLYKKCWRFQKIKSTPAIIKTSFDFDFGDTVIKPEERAWPTGLKAVYLKWHTSCGCLIEQNRANEIYKDYCQTYTKGIKQLLLQSHITEQQQGKFIEAIAHQMSLVDSLVNYIMQKVFSMELDIASVLMHDELEAAIYLNRKGFIRAAGAIAGVVLERHLKQRCDRFNPKIKYGERETLGALIRKLEQTEMCDDVFITELRHLNSIRIKCDHDKSKEPTKEEIDKLIKRVGEMVKEILIA